MGTCRFRVKMIVEQRMTNLMNEAKATATMIRQSLASCAFRC